MRRLIAIVLMLWLPLQGFAGTVVAVCADHGAPISVGLAEMSKSLANCGAADARHSHAGVDVQPNDHAADATKHDHVGGGANPCNDCPAMCAALVQAHAASGTAGERCAAPARAGDEAFVSAACNPALEPPIAAA